MLRKAYFVHYYLDFANTYQLRWAPMSDKAAIAQLENEGFRRIKRRVAEDLVWAEKYRQKYDQSMSGYADKHIFPWDYDSDKDNWELPWEFDVDGAIVTRRER